MANAVAAARTTAWTVLTNFLRNGTGIGGDAVGRSGRSCVAVLEPRRCGCAEQTTIVLVRRQSRKWNCVVETQALLPDASGVQRDGSGREIVVIDAIEAGMLHHRLQLLLVRVDADRFREVAVARLVVGDDAA